MSQFVITDIHGCLKSFQALLEKIHFSKKDELYLLGDYVDRGPDVKGVFDFIWSLQKEGYSVFCLKGNHEQMLLDGRSNPVEEARWLRNGGEETLASFTRTGLRQIPTQYIDFMEQLDYYFEVDRYILVHAGLNFDLPNPLDGTHSMMWIRHWYENINHSWLGNRIVLHGHTPTPKELIYINSKRLDQIPALDIDAGCVFPRTGYAHLCAFELHNHRLYFQKNID